MKTKLVVIGLAAVIIATLIFGCTTSSGVVSMGQDTYMIARNQWGYQNPAQIKATVLQEAEDYCKSRGKVLKVTKTVEVGPHIGSEPAAEVCFKCLNPNDPELQRATPIEETVR